MNVKKVCTIAGVILLLAGAVFGQAPNFSVVAGGPQPILGDDIMMPGSALNVSGAGLEVNAISRPHNPAMTIAGFEFSIDLASTAVPGTPANIEATAGDQLADIYSSLVDGNNTLLWDGNGVFTAPNPTVPPLGLAEPFSAPFGDDLDAWENDDLVPASPLFFSLDLATAMSAGSFASDVLMATVGPGYDSPTPAVYASATQLGLSPFEDDIDALVVFDDGDNVFGPGDYIQFSLAPGSFSLIISGLSPADILQVDFGGPFYLLLPAGALGLNPTDNVDALDVTLAVEVNRYILWLEQHSLSGNDSTRDADVEGDGMDNLLEYALGGDPNIDDAATIQPTGVLTEELGINWLVHVHNERTDDGNLTFTVQSNTNLVSGTWSTNDVSFVGESGVDGNGFKSVTNRISANAETQQFLQLEVETTESGDP
jgi:hypothetical protein